MRRFCRDRRGAIGVMSAMVMVCCIGAAALAVDVGTLFLKSRELQGIADLAALAAAQDTDNAQRLADETLRVNDAQRARARVDLGRYEPDRPIGARFVSDRETVNAVRVSVTEDAPVFFAAIFVRGGEVRIVREATAAAGSVASFQIGSRLLALRGGVANAVLSALTGSQVTLTALDYNALAQADVDLFSYFDALRTEADITAASFDDVAEARIKTNDALAALASTLRTQGDDDAAAAVAQLAHAADDAVLPGGLSRLFDLGPYGAQDMIADPRGAQIQLTALDLASAVLQIANGDRQLALDVSAAVPGLTSTQVWLAIGERPRNAPWIAVTADGDVTVRTAQMRLYLVANVGAAGALPVLRLPLYVEAASAEARLAAIDCSHDRARQRVMLDVAPSIGAAAIAEIDTARLGDFSEEMTLRPARVVNTWLLRVNAFARVDLSEKDWQRVMFTGSEIEQGIVKTVRSRGIASASASALVSNLDINVQTLGFGLGLDASALRAPLAAAATPLDALLEEITALLGVSLGEADVRVNGVRCHAPALVG